MPSSQGLCMSFEEKCKNIATHGLLTWSLKKIVVAISLGFFFRSFSYIVNVISRHLIHCINHFFLLVKFALYPSDMFLDCPRLYKWSTSVSSGTRSSNTFFFAVRRPHMACPHSWSTHVYSWCLSCSDCLLCLQRLPRLLLWRHSRIWLIKTTHHSCGHCLYLETYIYHRNKMAFFGRCEIGRGVGLVKRFGHLHVVHNAAYCSQHCMLWSSLWQVSIYKLTWPYFAHYIWLRKDAHLLA